MSLEKVISYFKQYGMEDRIIEVTGSSATVELAAKALQCEPQRIAKTLSFQIDDRVLVIVTAGDAKIDNRRYKEQFGVKAKMVDANQVEGLIGHAIGGVCPFAVNKDVEVYLDVSLQRFITVFPACGSTNSAIELTIKELEKHSKYLNWIDVCKGYAN